MKKILLIISSIIIIGLIFYGIWIFIRPSLNQSKIISFEVVRPSLVFKGINLSRVEIWAIPTGVEVNKNNYMLLGSASLNQTTDREQTWIFLIPQNPILVTDIFARGFNSQNEEVGDKFLPITGAVDIYNALWGANQEDNITIWDNTQTFSYGLTSRFSIKLDSTKYPEKNIIITPAGIVGSVSNVPTTSPPNYIVRYEGVNIGNCTFKNGDFNINLNIYYPEADNNYYVNSEYNFSFNYSPANLLNKNISYGFLTNNPIVRIDLPRNDFIDTNLAEASFIVGASKDKNILTNCLKLAQTETKQGNDIMINGINFSVFEGAEPAAGNLYETQSYRTVRDNICYEAVLFLHSGNIYNYSPDTVREFDKNKALLELQQILKTFLFTK